MGKISDALDKIESSDDFENGGLKHVREHLKEPISSRVAPGTDEEQIVEAIEITGKWQGKKEESTILETVSDITIEKVENQDEVSSKWDDRLFKAVNGKSKLPEVFQTLRSTIIHPPDGKKIPQAIMVTSSIAQEGKSFIAANLGVSFASGLNRHCLLVDCNLRKPTLGQSFGINRKYGLVDFLREQVNLADLIKETSVPKLSVLPSGCVPNNPAELLSSSRVSALFKISQACMRITLLFLTVRHCLRQRSLVILADKVDAIIMVVRHGVTKRTEVQRFVDVVDKAKILGIVFNDLPKDQ